MSSALPWKGALLAGQTLGHGLDGSGGANVLSMANDGNLYLTRRSDKRTLWRAGASVPGTQLWMQEDGNLVLKAPDMSNPAKPYTVTVWSSDTSASPVDEPSLWIQPDGNVVIVKKDGTPIWTLGPAVGPSSAGNVLGSGNSLLATDILRSPNGVFELWMQPDGNVLLTKKDGSQPSGFSTLWAIGPASIRDGCLVMQQDGNLVAYGPHVSGGVRAVYWSSGTDGNPGAVAVLTDQGEVEIRAVSGAVLKVIKAPPPKVTLSVRVSLNAGIVEPGDTAYVLDLAVYPSNAQWKSIKSNSFAPNGEVRGDDVMTIDVPIPQTSAQVQVRATVRVWRGALRLPDFVVDKIGGNSTIPFNPQPSVTTYHLDPVLVWNRKGDSPSVYYEGKMGGSIVP